MRSWFAPSSVWWPDPGPCPVDDAPHTTCCSADVAKRIVIVQLPSRDESLAASRPPITLPPVVTLQPGEVTTATYRRRRRG